jgi:hypothetical protein
MLISIFMNFFQLSTMDSGISIMLLVSGVCLITGINSFLCPMIQGALAGSKANLPRGSLNTARLCQRASGSLPLAMGRM